MSTRDIAGQTPLGAGPVATRALLTRRRFLLGTGGGLGAAALAVLLGADRVVAGKAPRAARPQVRARRAVYIHLIGGASQTDLFDPKPELRRREGEPCPEEHFDGKRFAFIKSRPQLLGSPYEFHRCGKSGTEISDLLPGLQGVADEITLVRSMQTDEFNHAPAQLFLLTGFGRLGRPSLGSWLSYGLGAENQDLPTFVVMVTGRYPGAGMALFGNGFLPTIHQGVEFRGGPEAVLFLSNPDGIDRADRRRIIDAVAELNELELADSGDREIATRVAQYEMAFRMQASVPDATDLDAEPERVRAMYGARPGTVSFANNCLRARRLLERGVRFVQLFDSGWDHHQGIYAFLPIKCAQVDRALSALIRDLAERGMLDDTLVVVATEFGRTPMAQTTGGTGKTVVAGRDHHGEAFSICLAGGGVKRGFVHGETDPLGATVVRDAVHVHDLNATLLHLLGIDHEQLTFRQQGRDFRLTDVHGRVIGELIA